MVNRHQESHPIKRYPDDDEYDSEDDYEESEEMPTSMESFIVSSMESDYEEFYDPNEINEAMHGIRKTMQKYKKNDQNVIKETNFH